MKFLQHELAFGNSGLRIYGATRLHADSVVTRAAVASGGEGAGREGPRMQRTNFRPRSDEVKQYRTWVTQKGVGAFVHSPREGRGAHFFSSK